jgi:hypothetical protein
MNENVVTLNVQDDLLSINDLIALHAARGQSILREREQALQEKARRQEEEREAHNEELWRPLVEAVRAAMPGWAHGFLVWNRRAEPYWHNRFEDRVYRPMIVRVPDCAPIEAYTLERPDDAAFQGVWFRAARPELRRDAELGWYILETACGLGEYTTARRRPQFRRGLVSGARKRQEPARPASRTGAEAGRGIERSQHARLHTAGRAAKTDRRATGSRPRRAGEADSGPAS